MTLLAPLHYLKRCALADDPQSICAFSLFFLYLCRTGRGTVKSGLPMLTHGMAVSALLRLRHLRPSAAAESSGFQRIYADAAIALLAIFSADISRHQNCRCRPGRS